MSTILLILASIVVLFRGQPFDFISGAGDIYVSYADKATNLSLTPANSHDVTAAQWQDERLLAVWVEDYGDLAASFLMYASYDATTDTWTSQPVPGDMTLVAKPHLYTTPTGMTLLYHAEIEGQDRVVRQVYNGESGQWLAPRLVNITFAPAVSR